MDFTENQLIHTYLRWIQREYCRTNCQRKTTLYWLRATIFYHKRDHAEIKVNVSKYFLVLEWMGLRRSGPFRTPSLNLFLLSFLPRDPITYRWRERQTMNHITVNVNILPLCKSPFSLKNPLVFYTFLLQCLKITEKVSFNIASDILRGQKLIKNATNGSVWWVFENLKLEVKQCYQTS